MLTPMGLVAMSYANVPYIWGGNNPLVGLDCSGFIQLVLRPFGLDPVGDQTANGLYRQLLLRNWRSTLGPDSLLFFGGHRNHITHVALALTDVMMIEAGGGDSQTLSVEAARKAMARVRVVPIKYRKDMVATIKAEYEV